MIIVLRRVACLAFSRPFRALPMGFDLPLHVGHELIVASPHHANKRDDGYIDGDSQKDRVSPA
jgi:hypothetical protein